MMLDRHTAPAINTDFKFSLIHPDVVKHHEIPIYYIGNHSPELVRIELIFNAGSIYQTQPLIASTTNDMLGEGTSKYTSAQLSEKLDYFGAYVTKDISHDHAAVSLFTVTRYLNQVLPLFREYLMDSIFPEHELQINLTNRKETLLHNLKKVEYVCRNGFAKLIYGEHPYGQSARPEDFENVTSDDLQTFYRHYYLSGPSVIMVAGNTSSEVRNQIESSLHDWLQPQTKSAAPPLLPYTPQQTEIEFQNAIQSAIRIGTPTISHTHPDYPILSLGNMILGGYFGSRLMKNIREEKGYTYGIGSGINSNQLSGTFLISTEAGTEYLYMLKDEVYKEIKRMLDEPVTADELNIVKNFISGNFLKSVDGFFAQSDRIKTLVLNQLPFNYYDNYLHIIKTATSQQIQACMQQYLPLNQLSEYVVKGVNS